MYLVHFAGEIVCNGDLEDSDVPAGWVFDNGGDTEVKGEWSSKVYRSAERSLSIEKPSGGSSVAVWSFGHSMSDWNWNSGWESGKSIRVGGYVKAEDLVGTAKIVYSFYKSGVNIFGEDIELVLPTGTYDWTKIENSESIVLPDGVDSIGIKLEVCSDGSGKVYFDDLICESEDGSWIGGDVYNLNLNIPKGWFYWVDKMASGEITHGIVTVSSEYAHSGRYSLKVMDRDGEGSEVVAISDRNEIPEGGKRYRFGVWVKLVGTPVDPDDSEKIGFTLTWHKDETGWAEIRGEDFKIVSQVASDIDWRYYEFEAEAPEDANRVSIRARFWHNVTGEAYFDDFTCEMIEETSTPIVENNEVKVKKTSIFQNYPNPFNPTTKISYYLEKPGTVKLEIYNLLGQKVKILVDNYQSAGQHSIVWNGRDKNNRKVPSGVYFYMLKTENKVYTRKMLLLK